MTPGRIVYSGTDAPTRPGTRGGSARGSVSGVCPEASRRPAGICATAALATLDQMISSGVSPVNLAGRSLGCPALFGERDHVSAAAGFLPCCAGRRRLLTPSPDGSRRQNFEFRAPARMAASGVERRARWSPGQVRAEPAKSAIFLRRRKEGAEEVELGLRGGNGYGGFGAFASVIVVACCPRKREVRGVAALREVRFCAYRASNTEIVLIEVEVGGEHLAQRAIAPATIRPGPRDDGLPFPDGAFQGLKRLRVHRPTPP